MEDEQEKVLNQANWQRQIGDLKRQKQAREQRALTGTRVTSVATATSSTVEQICNNAKTPGRFRKGRTKHNTCDVWKSENSIG